MSSLVHIALIFCFAVLGCLKGHGQDYLLDFTDTSTYRTNCGKVLPSGWTVRKDSCELHTPYLKTNDTISRWMEFSVKINQSGNLTDYNNAYIQHQVNLTAWFTDTAFIGEGLAPVAEYIDSIFLDTNDLFRIRVIYETDHQTRFWELKNGNIKAKVSLGDESTLPVELLHLKVNRTQSKIRINWATASETNNDYFIVQRSLNALEFDSIGYIPGQGNAHFTTEYEHIDYCEYQGTLYYRIKQVDLDGKYEYSYIITAAPAEEEDLIGYMNENSHYSLVINSQKNTPIEVKVYLSGSGQLIKQAEYNLLQGETKISLNELISQSGLYYVSTFINKKRYTRLIPFLK